ncbi:hypothetical protein [Vibrio diabolicus]|uniref:hypothetical protein n=1 Tax=Vibrio diabolicus TaxID=50719 RepID=UPI003F85893B
MERTRPVRISVYFTDSEIDKLKDKYQIDPLNKRPNGKLAGYMREQILNGKISESRLDPISVSQFSELARLSSNFNQITHHLNKHNMSEYLNCDINELREILNKIRSTLININTNKGDKDESES